MIRPIIYLAFANNRENPFLDLQDEDDAIYSHFSKYGKGDLIIHRDQHTSADEMINFIQSYSDQISIFHFGGHAGSKLLTLADQSVRGKGISRLLSRQKNLKCVFLNGCNTGAMVEKLMYAGIPAVIATDRKIGNEAATEFAVEFYKGLTSDKSIKKSFEEAVDATEAKHEVSITFRSELAAEDLPIGNRKSFAWGLYSKNKKKLNWTLDQAKSDVIGLTEGSWPKFILLSLAILGIFFWLYSNFGSAFTALLFGGSVLFSGLGFLLKFLMSANQPVKKRLTAASVTFSNALFRPLPIVLSIFILLILGAFGSSVVLEHDDLEEPEMKIESANTKSIMQCKVGTGRKNRSRLVFLQNPFSQGRRLIVEGYHPQDLEIEFFTRNALLTKELKVKSSLFIRLNAWDIRNANKIQVTIERDSIDIIRDTMRNASLLIGSRMDVQDTMMNRWKREYYSMGGLSRMQELCLEKWSLPRVLPDSNGFVPGQHIRITWKINDISKQKEIKILNKKINDVLLEKLAH